MVVKVGFAKLGNIGGGLLTEFLLDERAERQDIEVVVVGSGSKIGAQAAETVVDTLIKLKPDLAIVTSPNAALPGPTKAREALKASNIPTIIISDSPAKKASKGIEELGQGYIIVDADSMLGARREFLDPIEMALFNADLVKVLSITGAYNLIYKELDKVIESLKKGGEPVLPRIVVKKENSIEASGLSNPYARAKAIAAYETTRRVADLTVEGCFIIKEWEKYTSIVASAHEMMRIAAKLAEEAREVEKVNDTIFRAPHHDDGAILKKKKLIEKPVRSSEV